MKKFAIAFVALCSVFVLGACSNGSSERNEISQTSDDTSVVSEQSKPTLYASPSSVTLYKDGSQQINLTLEGQNVSLSDYNWRCNNEKIAQVDPNGVITGIIPGICTVEAYSVNDPDIAVEIEVTVMSNAAMNSIVEPSGESSEESSKTESSEEESKEESSNEESSEESSGDESSEEESVTFIDYTGYGSVFDSESPRYDKETLDSVHDYIQSIARSGETISGEGLTKEQAQMLVNTIYATYGYEFGEGGTMQSGYDSCTWYDGTTSDSYQVIDNIGDQQNIKDSIDNLGHYINSLD